MRSYSVGWQGFVKYGIEMASSNMIYIHSFTEIGSDV
jgi:hypothetical protein